MDVMTTCDFGLMNGGLLADVLALSKILDMRLVFVSNEAYVMLNPTPMPNLFIEQVHMLGLAKSEKVILKHTKKPDNNMKLTSLPLALTTGVSLYIANVIITTIVNTIPNSDRHPGTRA
jgi:hydrogenase maturation factor HypE